MQFPWFNNNEKVLPLTEGEIWQLQERISAVEHLSSVEFKIILVQSSWLGLRYKARRLFRKYGLQQTIDGNAILILVDYQSHKFLLYGDKPVFKRMGETFWNEMYELLSGAFAGSSLYQALSSTVDILGFTLAKYYPVGESDNNEISNELVFEE